MSDPSPPDLQALVARVQKSDKYAQVCPELIERVGARELAIRRSLKEAIKATKAKLHQIGGAYLMSRPPYADWLRELERLARPDEPPSDALRALCREMLAQHASTRERLGILERFFAETLAPIAPVASVADLACGLNPLAAPWMPLAVGARYAAYDIYGDLAAFLGRALPLLGLRGIAEARDVLQQPPQEPVELALLLKSIPCLEQLDKDAGRRLLTAIPARHILVSFPARSLGGHDKAMVANYEARFRELAAGEAWRIQRYAYESELAFLITKPAPVVD